MPSTSPSLDPSSFSHPHSQSLSENTVAKPSASASSSSSTAHGALSGAHPQPTSAPIHLDTSVATSADAGPSSRSPYGEEIEMDSINPAGHRRRRSSLLNPATPATSSRGTRPRGQSIRDQPGLGDEPKIAEEGDESDGRRDEQLGEDSMSDEDLHDDEETGLTKHDKKRKSRKRRRNTLLDQRIVRDKITAEEKKEADHNVVRTLVINGILILLWYLFSLCISLYNKWMFDDNRLDFPFPLFTTAIHMLVQFSLASLVLYFIPSLRPHNATGHISDMGQSRHEPETERPLMTKMFYLTRIGPCGAATSLDIGLGNTSLRFITLTFYTMCKSSSLAFVLIFAFLFRLEAPTWRLVAIIATMTVGVVMMVAGEVEFKLGGFILIISAAFFSGFRWALTQILLLRNPATSNPFSSIFFLAPVMFLTLICIAIPVEGFWALLDGLKTLVNEWGAFTTPLLILFPGTIAFLMTASEFALLQRTSVVTLSIAGIFKEVVTISTATLVFDDKLTPINISGLFVTLGAIIAYNYIKITRMREDAQEDVHRGHMDHVVGSSSNSGSGEEDESGEEAGLLNSHADDLQITVDGDMIPRPQASPSTDDDRHKSERED